MAFSSDNPLVTNQLPISMDFGDLNKPEFKDILSLRDKTVVSAVNTKTSGLYLLQETATFNQFFTVNNPQVNRNVYRSCFDMVFLNGGNIAGGATVNFPHNISGLSSATLIYAGCTSTDPRYFTVVYPNVYLDATNVWFVNPLGTAVTVCNVVAEYLKN